MALPLLPLAIKGLFVLGKAIASHGLAAKAGYLAVKAVSTYGLSATVGGALTVGVAVGGVLWAQERVYFLRLGFQALENGNAEDAIKYFAKLAMSLNTAADALPHAVHDYLITINQGEEIADNVADLLRDLKEDISDEIRRLN